MGMGFDGFGYGYCGSRGYRNPCGFGPQVPRKSTLQGGMSPPCSVDLRFSTQQGGRNPPGRVDSIHVCVSGGGSNGLGEQLGRGGRTLELE